MRTRTLSRYFDAVTRRRGDTVRTSNLFLRVSVSPCLRVCFFIAFSFLTFNWMNEAAASTMSMASARGAKSARSPEQAVQPDPDNDPLMAAVAEAHPASSVGASAVTPLAKPVVAPAAVPSPSAPLSSDTVLEQGKVLYEHGEYLPALDKFMQVLRRDPHQAEARQYLRMVMNQLRNQKGIVVKPAPDNARGVGPAGATLTPTARSAQVKAESRPSTADVEEDVRQRVRQRKLLTLDLAAIPGVRVSVDSKQAQVVMDSSLLFTDKTGGLKEDGIPILDRVSAWLKTFGQQPVVIHCYPEELTSGSLTGSLFLHRYAQLYGYFVDERKLPATRFVNAGLVKGPSGSAEAETTDAAMDNPPAENPAAAVQVSSTVSQVVIVSLGGGALPGDEVLPSQMTRWLEFSILPSRQNFNPEDGDWANLDLSAISRKGIHDWHFKIRPAAHPATDVLSMDGKGNLLKRISWDGRDQKSGSFVASGDYVCRLSATNAEGNTLHQDITLKVQRSGDSAAAVAARPKKPARVASKPKPKPKPKLKPAPVAEPVAQDVEAASPTVIAVAAATPPAPKPVVPAPKPVPVPVAKAEPVPAPAPAVEPEPEAPAETEADNSVHAIWKQVIQFDAGESDLKPTLKASLERIGKTLEVYPLQKVRIIGFSDSSEANASGLAKQRAEMVRDTLINEYQVDARRVIVAGGRAGKGSSSHPMSKVEISITN